MGKGKRRLERERAATAELEALAARHEFDVSGMLGHDEGSYVINVNERTALGIDAVFACVSRIADAISGATVGEWRGTERLPDSRLTLRPMATMKRREWLWFVTATLALYTDCYLRHLGRDADGTPLSLVPIVPTRLSNVGGKVLLDGREELDPSELSRIRRYWWPTLDTETSSVLRLAREAFATAAAQGAYTADFWENGGAPLIYISTEQPLSNTEAATIRDDYSTARRDNPGKPAVFGKGAAPKPLGVDLGQTGAGESGDRLLASIARYFGVQPWLINAPSAAGSLVYANTQASGTDLVNYTLDGYRGAIADEWSDNLPGGYLTGRRVELDLSHLTRGTLLEQFQAYAIATGSRPWMLPSEVRTDLRMAPDMALDEAGAPPPALESIPVAESAL